MRTPIEVPRLSGLDELLPPDLPLMMGVGPVPVPPEVARAHSVVINHLGPIMNGVMRSLQSMGRYVFQTRNERVFCVSGPASGAMEMAICNLLWAGERALIGVNGTFSERLARMAERAGAEVTRIIMPPGAHLRAELVEDALNKNGPFAVFAMVQGETSCGVFNPELADCMRLAREHGAVTVADTVVTLSTCAFRQDEWGIDVAFTGGQKGLAAIPGVSPINFSQRAWDRLQRRPQPPAQWVLDARLAERFWVHHEYHYTAPTAGILAVHEALRLICEETLEARAARHAASSLALQRGVEALGLSLFTPEASRLHTAVAIELPSHIDAGALRAHMEHNAGVQIAGAFGLPIVRIGQMGEQCRPEPMQRTLEALGRALVAQGFPCAPEAGWEAARVA